jgi:hypothetical protein
MFGVMRLIFDDDCESMSGEEDFFSVARTMPLVAEWCQSSYEYAERTYIPLMPSEVTPWLTAFRAYSMRLLDCNSVVDCLYQHTPICTSFPLLRISEQLSSDCWKH